MDKFQEKIRKESEANNYKIGVFQGKNADSYRTQFYSIFGYGCNHSIKNQKSLLKQWFDQVSLEGTNVELCINKSHNIQLKDNKYLKQLVKEKYVKLIRSGIPHCKRTHLVKI